MPLTRLEQTVALVVQFRARRFLTEQFFEEGGRLPTRINAEPGPHADDGVGTDHTSKRLQLLAVRHDFGDTEFVALKRPGVRAPHDEIELENASRRQDAGARRPPPPSTIPVITEVVIAANSSSGFRRPASGVE